MTNRICIFGDSIAWGAYDLEEGGWATRLHQSLSSLEHNFEIYNLGISGDNTNWLLKRFEIECKARDPQTILIAIGVNDSSYSDANDEVPVLLEQFEENIEKLIEIAKKFTDKIILISITPVDETKTIPIPWLPTLFHTNENVKKYNDKLEIITNKNGVHYCDITGLLNTEDLEDGLHPNAKGHEKIFKKIKEFFAEEKIIL